MNRTTAAPCVRLSVIALATASLAGCGGPEETYSGAFVVRLGTDTVAVERFVRTGERLEAVAVTRSPVTRVRETVLTFGAGGGVSRYESAVRAAGAAADAPPEQHTVVTFGPDSAIVETTRDGETRTETVAATPEMIPSSFDHFSLEELVIQRARASGQDTIYRPGDPASPVIVRAVGADSVALETSNLGTWRARIDSDGRILQMEAGALGRTIERVAELDVDSLAARWADEDARGVGMGPLSPRDTLEAEIDGARITVDYSRPSKRGREVFGGLVPWDEVWRTGANAATQLTTDRALVFDDTRVPAGTYTLFTIPHPEGWTLIINRQTGQAGTDYDPAEDLARLEMQVRSLAEPVERFTIAVQDTGEGGRLTMSWDQTEASLPFRAALP